MAGRRKKRTRKSARKSIEQYEHTDKQRANNPPVGLVKPETDPAGGKNTYAYDPHLDPQLVWAGKAEHTSFDVETVSLHVHERVDPKTILSAVRKDGKEAEREARGEGAPRQMSFFEAPAENPPLRDALDFYKHPHGWSNRLVAGDSLLVMNSLLEKEGLAGKVQMVYIDPPYGIRYGSNFQPFVNRRDVKDGKDEDLTQEPEMIRAFRDTWELGIHSYLTYLRDRLLLARELLHESGSCFVQINDENVHHIRELMDEVFGAKNFAGLVAFRKTTGKASARLDATFDVLLWYAQDLKKAKYRQLFDERTVRDDYNLRWIERSSGEWVRCNRIEELDKEIAEGGRPFRPNPLTSQTPSDTITYTYEFNGKEFSPGTRGWSTNRAGMERLEAAGRLIAQGNTLGFIRYLDDFPFKPINNIWDDTRLSGFADHKLYVVQTSPRVVQRCLLMTTDPGDLVFDPTCGSGTTAYVAEQWGRRWITCDTSRVAVALARQRLMTAVYDYYELAHPEEGVGSGFVYKTVPHVTLKSIANNPDIVEGMSREEIDAAIARHADQETLYDQPRVDRSKARVAGPFTVEAVPSPVVKPVDTLVEGEEEPAERPAADASEARTGITLRHAEWREELLKTGIRGKSGQRILFSRVEPLAGTRWLHAEGETKPNDLGSDRVGDGPDGPQRVVISFGPEHGPLEQRQVELAWQEARDLHPRPAILAFAAFQFDPEAAKDIDELPPERAGMTLLKVQMNADMLTEDLKKKRASNESFWLVGQPDVELRRVTSGEHKGRWQVEVRGFDYYNTKTGRIESGDVGRIALWMLDTDYDDRSLYARQVFFPMAGEREGWARVARSLRAEIDEERIEAYRGTASLPFDARPGQRIAVKIVDDRGIESLRILLVD